MVRGHQIRGVVARLRSGRGARSRPKDQALGKLETIDKVRMTLDQAKALPGDPWLAEDRRWKEEKDRLERRKSEKRIPSDTPVPDHPGALAGDALRLFECRYNGKRDACCELEAARLAKVEPKGSAGRGRPSAACPGPFPSLVDDLLEYVPYMFRKVLGSEYGKLRNDEGKVKEVVDLLYQYGCKRIDRLLPGFAKIVMKRISTDIDLVGNWDKPIDELPNAQAEKKKKGKKDTKVYEPPKRDEFIEICSVTHKQLDATLRKDLGIIVKHAWRTGKAAAELICPLSESKNCNNYKELLKQPPRLSRSRRRPSRKMAARSRLQATIRQWTAEVSNLREAVKSVSVTAVKRGFVLALRRAVHLLLMRAAAGRVDERLKAQAGALAGAAASLARAAMRAAAAGARAVLAKAAKEANLAAQRLNKKGEPLIHLAFRLGNATIWVGRTLSDIGLTRGAGAVVRLLTQSATLPLGPRVALQHRAFGAVNRLVRRSNSADLFKARKELEGEAFHDIVKRLLAFYRRTGAVRRFVRATGKIGSQIQKLGHQAPKTKEAEEIGNHTKPGVVKTRNRRGLLRRQVEQWTSGFEYERLRDFLEISGKSGSRVAGQYSSVERKELAAFWSSCLEIYQLCEEPQTPKELKACKACAERAVREHCIDGVEPTSKKCAGGHVRVAGYLGARSSDSLKGGRDARRAKEDESRRLHRFLEEHKWCIADGEKAYQDTKSPPRWSTVPPHLSRYVPAMRGFPPWDAYESLKKVVRAGNTSEFVRLWGLWSMKDCFKCTTHREWHTKHAHCTIMHGGNSGPFKGPAFEACKAGHDIGRWVDTGIKKLLGKSTLHDQPPQLSTLNHAEFHQLYIGTPDKNALKVPAQYQKPLKPMKLGDGHNTLLNWLAMQLIGNATDSRYHRGHSVFDGSKNPSYKRNVIRNVVGSKFLPKESDPQKGMTNDGLRYLNLLPITPWQRCYLWSPNGGRSCKPGTDIQEMVATQRSRLFQIVFDEVPIVNKYMDSFGEGWKNICSLAGVKQEFFWFVPIPFTKKIQPTFDCRSMAGAAEYKARKDFKLGGITEKTADLGAAGAAVESAAEPIVGKIIGLLLKAAGMYETMKTLAKAAGLTPEQSADCEDEEYRHDVLKIEPCTASGPLDDKCQDTKRGCLLKVFAKNFGTVLESILVMLANKLVDWGVDGLRTLLEPLRSGLIAAAGSVPVAGGVLAAAINVAWELLMNFGAKAILKGFVTNKLPEWLKIRELANQAMDELMKHPIVQVIAGIILQLISAAMIHGEKSWMAVGVDTAINAIQGVLQNITPRPPFFWIRALHYAKKEMARRFTGEGSLLDQLRELAQAMIGGFGAAIGRGITDETARQSFTAAIDDIKGLLKQGGIGKLLADFQQGPVKFLTNLIAQKIGPVVMPIVTAFVPMDAWAKAMLQRLGGAMAKTVEEIGKGRLGGSQLIQRILHVFEPEKTPCPDRVFCRLFDGLPADKALKDLLKNGFTKLTGILRNLDQIPGYLSRPWDIVSGLVALLGDFLKEKVEDLFAGFGTEKKLVAAGVSTLIEVFADKQLRDRLLSRQGDAAALLAKLATALRPYAVERFEDLAQGTGLETMIKEAVGFFFGKEGPLVRGEAFLRELPERLRRHGPAIAAQVLEAVAGIVTAQAAHAGRPALGRLAQGVLGTLGQIIRKPGGLTSLSKGQASDVLKLVKDALGPLVETVAPSKAKPSPVSSLVRKVLTGVLDLLGNPTDLRQLAQRGASALGGLAKQIASALRSAMRATVTELVPDRGLQELATSGVDGFFDLLSDPAKMARLRGAKALELLRDVGGRLFTFVQAKLASVKAAAGPAGAAAKALAGAIVGQVQQTLGSPSRIEALVGGTAKELLSRVVETLHKPALGLVESAAPPAVKAVLKQVAGEALAFLSRPSRLGQLGSLSAGALLKETAPVLRRLLEGLLKPAVPPGTWSAVQAAIAKVQAGLANPAGSGASAGAAAKQAIDQVIAAAVFQISDPDLRMLASNLVALARDLVAGNAAAAKLRGDARAILGRLATTAASYVASLVPAGPVKEIVLRAMAGLTELLTSPMGVARSLARKATALLPGIQNGLVGLVQTMLRRAIPDNRTALLIGGLTREVVAQVAEPERWAELQKQGVGGLLSRLLPVAREYALSMLGRLGGGKLAELRPIVEGLFEALGDAGSVARFSKSPVSALVSLGVSSVLPVVLRLVERATGAPGVTAFMRKALGKLASLLSRPAELAAFLKKTASEAFGALLGEAKALAESLVGGVVQNPTLKAFAQAGLKGVLAYVHKGAGGADVLSAAKAILEKLIPAAAGLLRGKLAARIPDRLGKLKEIVTEAFDKLTSFATGLVTKGQAAWKELTTGGGNLLGVLLGKLVGVLKPPLQEAIRDVGLRALVTGLIDTLPQLLGRPPAARGGQDTVKVVLGEIGRVLQKFLTQAITPRLPPGLAQTLVGGVLHEGIELFKDPTKLTRFITKAKNAKGLVGEIFGGLASKLKGTVKGAIGDIVEAGLGQLAKGLVK